MSDAGDVYVLIRDDAGGRELYDDGLHSLYDAIQFAQHQWGEGVELRIGMVTNILTLEDDDKPRCRFIVKHGDEEEPPEYCENAATLGSMLCESHEED